MICGDVLPFHVLICIVQAMSTFSGRVLTRFPKSKPTKRVPSICPEICCRSFPMSVRCSSRTFSRRKMGSGFPMPKGSRKERIEQKGRVTVEGKSRASRERVGCKFSSGVCSRTSFESLARTLSRFWRANVHPAACACPPNESRRSEIRSSPSVTL